MGQKIVGAIIEDGQITQVDNELPRGRIRVHLVYNTTEKRELESSSENIVRETSGIYKDINAKMEIEQLRSEWERNLEN